MSDDGPVCFVTDLPMAWCGHCRGPKAEPKPTTVRVWPIDGGDSFTVTGTDDVEAARRAVFEHLLAVGDHTPDEAADRIYRLQPEMAPEGLRGVWLT